jgi:hypothetical protein
MEKPTRITAKMATNNKDRRKRKLCSMLRSAVGEWEG